MSQMAGGTHSLRKPKGGKNGSDVVIDAMVCHIESLPHRERSLARSSHGGSDGIALPGRLELPTLRLTASRSNQLSYGSHASLRGHIG